MPEKATAPPTRLKKFFVISYDPDQQQWFFDFVPALTPEAAQEEVCAVRDYVIDADAIELAGMERIVRQLRYRSLKATIREWEALKRELAPGEPATPEASPVPA